jgi:hypothetical protein
MSIEIITQYMTVEEAMELRLLKVESKKYM